MIGGMDLFRCCYIMHQLTHLPAGRDATDEFPPPTKGQRVINLHSFPGFGVFSFFGGCREAAITAGTFTKLTVEQDVLGLVPGATSLDASIARWSYFLSH